MKRGGVDSIGVGALISGRGGDVPVRCARGLPTLANFIAQFLACYLCGGKQRNSSGMLQQAYLLLGLLAPGVIY